MALTGESLVEAHLDAVYAYARAKLRQEDLAREMGQRTFLKTFEKLSQLRELPLGTIQSRLHRAKAALKSALTGEGPSLKGGAV